MSRPENEAPPEIFYNESESKKYANNSRMIEIQTQLSERALELLCLPEDEPRCILDIGCGSGLSGEVLTEAGHTWIGLDISSSMLDVAKDREVEGDLVLRDMGDGLPFRAGMFDGAISVSALQWLCHSYRTGEVPKRRMKVFFNSLFACLRKGARAVFQFYPETSKQIDMLTSCAMKSGFSGGLIIDYPNSTKAKKYFLCLFAGPSDEPLPSGLGTEVTDADEVDTIAYSNKRKRGRDGSSSSSSSNGKNAVKSRGWIKAKKERQRRQGKEVRPDSKYTGRKRPRW